MIQICGKISINRSILINKMNTFTIAMKKLAEFKMMCSEKTKNVNHLYLF